MRTASLVVAAVIAAACGGSSNPKVDGAGPSGDGPTSDSKAIDARPLDGSTAAVADGVRCGADCHANEQCCPVTFAGTTGVYSECKTSC